MNRDANCSWQTVFARGAIVAPAQLVASLSRNRADCLVGGWDVRGEMSK